MNPNPKTLLVIFAHSTVGETVKRHWPLWLLSGCDILGVGREDTVCQWPAIGGQFIGAINVGKESYADGDNHIRRFLDTLEHCLTAPALKPYGAYCFCEYDCLIFKPIPPIKPGSFAAKLAGGRDCDFRGTAYYHTPWHLDRIMAGRILVHGRAMLRAGLIEHGFIDRWLGLLFDLHGIACTDTGAATYTRNTIEPCHFDEFRAAIESGIWHAHGVKTQECLQVALDAQAEALHATMAGQQNAEAVAALNAQ
jgi:hypothetical protein